MASWATPVWGTNAFYVDDDPAALDREVGRWLDVAPVGMIGISPAR